MQYACNHFPKFLEWNFLAHGKWGWHQKEESFGKCWKQSKALGGSKLDNVAGEDLKLHFMRSGLGAEPSWTNCRTAFKLARCGKWKVQTRQKWGRKVHFKAALTTKHIVAGSAHQQLSCVALLNLIIKSSYLSGHKIWHCHLTRWWPASGWQERLEWRSGAGAARARWRYENHGDLSGVATGSEGGGHEVVDKGSAQPHGL